MFRKKIGTFDDILGVRKQKKIHPYETQMKISTFVNIATAAVFGFFVDHTEGSRKVFQGSCSLPAVNQRVGAVVGGGSINNNHCEQSCQDLADGTYYCACWPEYRLQDDGIECLPFNSEIKISTKSFAQTPRHSAISPFFNGNNSLFQLLRTKTPIQPTKSQRILSNNLIDYHPEARNNGGGGGGGGGLRFKSSRQILFEENDADLSPSANESSNFSSSYALFPVPHSAYLQTNISITYKQENWLRANVDSQLLFYAGQLYGRDFLSIILQSTNVILRFDCGEGIVEEEYIGPFQVGEWHMVNVSRHFCDSAQIAVDKPRQKLIDHTNLETYKGISMSKWLYLGGLPGKIKESAFRKANADSGFHGCVSRLIVNDEKLLDYSSSSASSSIIDQSTNQQNVAYCHTGDEPKESENLKTTTNLRQQTETTSAPDDKDGDSSAFENDPDRPSGSFLHEFKAPQDLNEYMELLIDFTPSPADPSSSSSNLAKIGLIFYAGNARLNEYMAVFVRSGFVYYQFNLGTGSSVIRSESVISGEVRIEAWRTGRGGLLKVSGQNWAEGIPIENGHQFLHPISTVYYYSGFSSAYSKSSAKQLPAFLPKHLVPLVGDGQSGEAAGSFGCVSKIIVNNLDVLRRQDDVGVKERLKLCRN